MRRIRNILLIITFMLLIGVSFNVKAEGFEYYITNSNSYEPVNNNDVKDIKRGDTIIVTAMLSNINDVTDYKISSGKLTIRWDDKYLKLEEVNGKYYNDSISDITGLTLASIEKLSSRLTIGEISSTGTLKSKLNKLVDFKFTVLENAPAGDTRIYQMDGEASLKCKNSEENVVSCGESALSELKYNIQKSTINKLSSIKLNGMALEYFNEDTNNYDIEVEDNVEKINIEVTKKDDRSNISGDTGEKALSYGRNELEITVTSESGDANTYRFAVTRTDSRSSVNTLKALVLSAGEIKFKPDVNEYSITVNNEVDKLTIKSALTDSKSKYVEDFTEKEIELVEGSNKVEIKVVSEKGEENTYTLNINRLLSSNNSLKSLKVNDDKIELKENEFIYNFSVETEVEEVVIKAEANDSKATVKLNDKYPLEIGENEIRLVVVAADGKEASYILNITRSKELSKNSLLTSIKIRNYDINFKPEDTLYNLKIDDKDEKLDITTTQEDPNATVEIEGNKDLVNGSIIKINVKAEDGSFTRYFINIEKGSKGISPVIIIILVLLVLLGICLGLIFYLKKKKEQKEFDNIGKEENNEIEEPAPMGTTFDNENEVNNEQELENNNEENKNVE